jgi:hypothetical protein
VEKGKKGKIVRERKKSEMLMSRRETENRDYMPGDMIVVGWSGRESGGG